jgi:hypothetical protein
MRGFGARSSSGFTFLGSQAWRSWCAATAKYGLDPASASRHAIVRAAIDKFKDNCKPGCSPDRKIFGADCYPTSLEHLVEGAAEQ